MGKITIGGRQIVAWGADARPAKKARSNYMIGRRYWGGTPWTGEKNLGEAGPLKEYFLDHQTLVTRGWQTYLESKVVNMAVNRLARWVIGPGLTLQCQPETKLLETEGVTLDSEAFNEVVESRYEVWANSTMGDYAGMRSLHMVAHTAFVNMLNGGDVLVICRIVKGSVKVQLIDACHVCNPMGISIGVTGDAYFGDNIIRNGVEIDGTGQHVAFHVRYSPMEWQRVEARNPKTGQQMAWMGSMVDHRLDDTRALPVAAAVIETATVLDRYQEATVASAEEVANVVMFAEHDVNSTGENPFPKGVAKIKDFDAQDDVPVDMDGKQLAEDVYASTKKQLFNMPPGAKLSTLKSEQPIYFKEFYGTVSDDVFSTIGIPPDVARMIYNNSFSASRAALKDWEHTLMTLRARFYKMFYAPIYALWLDTEVLKNKIQAAGYLLALMKGNEMVLAAYRNAVWTGANVPHIDPVKEVNAERLKLGPAFDNQPLTTLEAATMAVNGGDAQANVEQARKELARGKDIKPEVEPPALPADAGIGSGEPK